MMDSGSSFLLLFLLQAVIPLQLVTAFSVSRRPHGPTDLAEALDILQRQRRRVSLEDFLNAQPLVAGQPLTLNEVNEWLARDVSGDPIRSEDDWLPSDVGGDGSDFKEFEPPVVPFDVGPAVYSPRRIKVSDNEVKDIFDSDQADDDDDDDDDNIDNKFDDLSEAPKKKKTKEEVVEVQGDVNNRQRQRTSVRNEPRSGGEGLNSLTDEEVRVLMKAVGKLQQKAENLKDKKSASVSVEISGSFEPELQPEVVSEPISQEEMKSVFTETEGPVSKETEVLTSKHAGGKNPEVVAKEVISQELPDDSTLIKERLLTNQMPQAVRDEMESIPGDNMMPFSAVARAELVDEGQGESVVSEADVEAAIEAEEEKEEEEAAEEMEEEKEAQDVLAKEREEEQEQEQQEEAEAEEEEEVAEENAIANGMSNVGKENIPPALVSKYLMMARNKMYLPTNQPDVKRTAKRASGMFSNELSPYTGYKMAAGHVGVGELDSSALIQVFAAKILALQGEIDRLKFKSRLEDLENDELTQALNAATQVQGEGTVSGTEWKSLQHAIQIEQALQDLKTEESVEGEDVVDNDDDDVDDEDKAFDELVSIGSKRGEPWRKRQDVNDVMYPGAIASRSIRTQPDTDALANREISRLLEAADLMNEDNNDDDDDNDYGGDDLEEDEAEATQGLDDLGSVDDNEEEVEQDEDGSIASLFLSHAERCPAVRRYSDNCAMADQYGLPVDTEARALCNLHHMCYACGHSLGVSQGQCDLVYKAAVTSLCHRKQVCLEESEIFLRAMKLKTRFIPRMQQSCRTRCTAEFMGMF